MATDRQISRQMSYAALREFYRQTNPQGSTLAGTAQTKERKEYGMSRAQLSGKLGDSIREVILVGGGLLTGVGVMLAGPAAALLASNRVVALLGAGNKTQAVTEVVSAVVVLAPSVWAGLKTTNYIGNNAFDPVGSPEFEAAAADGKRRMEMARAVMGQRLAYG